ncbi:hypothetical protein [Nocardia altamirensis]|uniref:hypothetical protein n=1 Tax=Nocardia altamirensis TaxID=472158 RepID=UPI00114CD198|nr:hypothetical protein [Nocardia altamirensis]
MRKMLVILAVAGSLIAGSNAVANAEPAPVPPLCQLFGGPLALVKWMIDPYSQSTDPLAVAFRGVEHALCRPGQ